MCVCVCEVYIMIEKWNLNFFWFIFKDNAFNKEQSDLNKALNYEDNIEMKEKERCKIMK